MEQLLVTVEDVKNELDVSIADELDIQPRQADRWIMRQQQVILNYIALSVGGTEQAAPGANRANRLRCAQQLCSGGPCNEPGRSSRRAYNRSACASNAVKRGTAA